jgi:hypothetical protein
MHGVANLLANTIVQEGRMKRKLLLLVMGIALIAVAGCTTRLVDFTLISTKNVDLSRGADFKRAPTRVEGIDKIHIIVFVPTGVPNMKEAIDRAIESVPGAVAILDGVLSQRAWYIPFIYGQSMYVVEGTPLIDPALLAKAP